MSFALEQYVRHAELYGTECVYETAEEEGHGPTTLALLRIELDSIEAGRKSSSGKYTVGKRRRRGADETHRAVVALSTAGLIPAAIANKLDISKNRVQQLLRAPTPA